MLLVHDIGVTEPQIARRLGRIFEAYVQGRALTCLATLYYRRVTLGAELGGDQKKADMHAAFFIFLWMVYVGGSAVQEAQSLMGDAHSTNGSLSTSAHAAPIWRTGRS